MKADQDERRAVATVQRTSFVKRKGMIGKDERGQEIRVDMFRLCTSLKSRIRVKSQVACVQLGQHVDVMPLPQINRFHCAENYVLHDQAISSFFCANTSFLCGFLLR